MKMKSFAMVAMSGLLAASFAYVAPAMADDAIDAGQSAQTGTDNTMQNQTPAAMPSNNSAPTSADMNASGGGNADEGSPDTATGDDDY